MSISIISISIVGIVVSASVFLIFIHIVLTIDMPGMKQTKAGFSKEAFPWTGETETKEDERR